MMIHNTDNIHVDDDECLQQLTNIALDQLQQIHHRIDEIRDTRQLSSLYHIHHMNEAQPHSKQQATIFSSTNNTVAHKQLMYSQSVDEMNALEAQMCVWHLITLMVDEPNQYIPLPDHKMSDDDDDDDESDEAQTIRMFKHASHRLSLDHIRRRSRSFLRIGSLIKWLEHMARKKDSENSPITQDWTKPFNRRSLRHIRTKGLGDEAQHDSIVDSLEPDATTRQSKKLHPEDTRQDEKFWECVFLLLRRGQLYDRFDDVPSVIELCQMFGEESRAVSLSGGLEFHCTSTSVSGNRRRWLWRYTCRRLANTIGVGLWERAVYSLLSGDVNGVLGVCSSWHDYIWAHFQCHITLLEDHELFMILNDHHVTLSLCDSPDLLLPVQNESMAQIFQRAESSFFATHSTATITAYEVLCRLLVLDSHAELFSQVYTCMCEQNASETHLAIHHQPSFIEFGARLYLALSNSESDEANAKITQKFVHQLAASADQQHLVPDIIRQMPEAFQINEYSRFVNDFSDEEEQKYYLEQARSLFTPDIVDKISSQIVQLVVPNTTPSFTSRVTNTHLPMDANSSAILPSEVDKLIRCQALQPAAALKQANLFFRSYLSPSVNRVNDAIDLFQRFEEPEKLVTTDTIVSEDDALTSLSGCSMVELREYWCWHAYLKALVTLNDFQSHLSTQPLPSKCEQDDECLEHALRVAMDKSSSPQTWANNSNTLFNLGYNAVYQVVCFHNGWLRFASSNPRDSSLANLRRYTLSNLVQRFCTVCEQAKRFQSAVDMSVWICDTKCRAYDSISVCEREQLVAMMRNAYLHYAAKSRRSILTPATTHHHHTPISSTTSTSNK